MFGFRFVFNKFNAFANSSKNAFFGNKGFSPFTKKYTPFARGVMLSKLKLPSSNRYSSGGSRKYSTFIPNMDNKEKYVIGGIIGANVFVFILWNTYGSASEKNLNTMVDHFTWSYQNLREGRIYTLITSGFSQEEPTHLFFNMLNLFFFGPYILQRLGTNRFLFVYIAANVAAGLSQLARQYLEVPANRRKFVYLTPQMGVYYLGASASVFSINAIFAAMHPLHTVYFFFIPMPAIVVFGGLFLYDFYYMRRQQYSTTSHVGHVAGVVTGVLYYFLYLRRFRIV